MSYQVSREILPAELRGINFGGRRAGGARAVVWHVAEGSADGVRSWFNSPISRASTHYLVTLGGLVIQFLDESTFAYANGLLANPATGNANIRRWQGNGINPNDETIAIEREGQHGDPPTREQARVICELTADIMRRQSIAAADDNIMGHNEFDTVNRANCPGAIPWGSMLVEVYGLLQGTPGAVPVTTTTGGQNFDPRSPVVSRVTGKTLRGEIRVHYESYGARALDTFGYPITEEIEERIGEWRGVVQYFERGRLEWHPELGEHGRVLGGQIGRELLQARGR